MEAWHVGLVRPGFEGIGFGALCDQCVWPRWVERRVYRGNQVDVVRSMAPGYLIVRFGEGGAEWHRVAAALGDSFRRFIGGEFPEPVADGVVDGFLARCLDVTGLMEAPFSRAGAFRAYRAGEVVRLVGVLGAVSGVVTWADDRGVRVTATLFNRATELWLPRGSGMIDGDGPAEGAERKRGRRSRRGSRAGRGEAFLA